MKYQEIQIYKENGSWYLFDKNNPDLNFQNVGPYNTKAEAAEGKAGLKNFWIHHHGTKPKKGKK